MRDRHIKRSRALFILGIALLVAGIITQMLSDFGIFGPVVWDQPDRFQVLAFILICVGAMCLGESLGGWKE